MPYPDELDSLTRPNPSDPLNNPSHTVVHAALATAVEALKEKVGIDDSADENSFDYRIAALEDEELEIADVDGLQAALDGKSDDGHTHGIADTTGLQDALDGKASTAHPRCASRSSSIPIRSTTKRSRS